MRIIDRYFSLYIITFWFLSHKSVADFEIKLISQLLICTWKLGHNKWHFAFYKIYMYCFVYCLSKLYIKYTSVLILHPNHGNTCNTYSNMFKNDMLYAFKYMHIHLLWYVFFPELHKNKIIVEYIVILFHTN